MTDKTILIVEDEAAIRQMVAFGLARAGYTVQEAGDCSQARAAVADQVPDLVLLDWMLPDLSGIEYARALRRDPATRDVPIIMLTARAEEDDKVRGLDAGVDDYMTKPFSTRELVSRIKAVLRRAAPDAGEDLLVVGAMSLNSASHRVQAGDQEVELGPTEFRLLRFFMAHPDRVFSRAQLLDRVWGGNVYVEERTIDVHIRRLRKALEAGGFDAYVQTVRGSGYRFAEPRS